MYTNATSHVVGIECHIAREYISRHLDDYATSFAIASVKKCMGREPVSRQFSDIERRHYHPINLFLEQISCHYLRSAVYAVDAV